MLDRSELSDYVNNEVNQIIEWGTEMLERDIFPRSDYKQLLELTIIYLGGFVYPFNFHKPGAHHHARFMSNALYFLKMQLLSRRFDMSHQEAMNVKRTAKFVAICYTRAFLTSLLPSQSPANDLKFMSLVHTYKQVDQEASDICLKSCRNHLWYVTKELVILSIFDNDLSYDLREKMVLKLLSFPCRTKFDPEKPVFSVISFDSINFPDQLVSFIGPRSWLLFTLLQKTDEKLDWMKVPAQFWKNLIGYTEIGKVVHSMEVVNHSAERGIKLLSDFKDVCTDVTEQQALLQLVEKYRITKRL